MAEISKELMAKLMKAGDQEKVAALLKAEGQDDAPLPETERKTFVLKTEAAEPKLV